MDGKVTKEELPDFLEALAGFVLAVVAVVLPFLSGGARTVANRLAGGLALASKEAHR